MAERPLAELARSHGASDVGWAVRSVAWVGPEHGVAFGGDGMRLHRVDPASKVELGAWDVPDRRPMFMPEVEGDAAALARLSPDKRREMCVADTPDVSVIAADRARGRVLVGGAWHQAWVLEAAPGGWKEVATIRGLPTLLADAAFSADGSRVALVCSVSGTRFAEAESPEALQAAKRWFRVLVADAATGDDLTARVVRPEDVDGVTRPRAVAWSPDGRLVVGRDGGIVQAVTDRRPDVVGSISANGAPTKGADVTDLAFGRGDGGDVLWFVTGVDAVKDPSASKGTGTLAGCRWPPGRPGPEPLRLEGLEGIVSIDLSPCGRLAALGHTDGSVSVFPLTPP